MPIWNDPPAGRNEQRSPDLKRRIRERTNRHLDDRTNPLNVVESKAEDTDRGKGRGPEGKDLSSAPEVLPQESRARTPNGLPPRGPQERSGISRSQGGGREKA